MNISYKDDFYYLDFTNEKTEELFFINSINLSLTLLTETKKNSKEISPIMDKILKKILNYHNKNKFLLKNSEFVYKVKKEYLDILLEHVETFLMMILKKDTSLSDSYRSQYTFLNNFFKEFLSALKKESASQ